MYCNLLQCTHLATTCIVAEKGGRLDGVGQWAPTLHLFIFNGSSSCALTSKKPGK